MFTMAQAKMFFTAGVLRSFSVDKTIGGWLLHLEGKTASSSGFVVDARNNQARIFKSIDSAVTTAQSVGFTVDSLKFRSI
jgi:hypothetical protein